MTITTNILAVAQFALLVAVAFLLTMALAFCVALLIDYMRD